MDKKFLITQNPESAAILIRLGFNLVNENGKTWTFMNNKKIVFQKLDDVTSTDKLCI